MFYTFYGHYLCNLSQIIDFIKINVHETAYIISTLLMVCDFIFNQISSYIHIQTNTVKKVLSINKTIYC